jgi:hypothetical protein
MRQKMSERIIDPHRGPIILSLMKPPAAVVCEGKFQKAAA